MRVGPGRRRLRQRGPVRAFRPTLERAERRLLLTNYTVTTTSDTPIPGFLTLRQAITNANAHPGPDSISFSFPAVNTPGVINFNETYLTWTIPLTSGLPAITDALLIDGYSQEAYYIPPIVGAVPTLVQSTPNT